MTTTLFSNTQPIGVLSPATFARGAGRRAFTLVELMIVILIIGILASVLLASVLGAFSTSKEHTTKNLINDIRTAIDKWREGEGKPIGAYPQSGKNELGEKKRFEGNLKLFQALVTDRKKAGKEPYINIDEDLVGYLDADGVTVHKAETPGRGVFLDGFGTPIVYWEWKSLADPVPDPNDPMGRSKMVAPALPAYAQMKGSYDTYSAGGDKIWGTNDDAGNGGERVEDGKNPFAGSAPATGKEKISPTKTGK